MSSAKPTRVCAVDDDPFILKLLEGVLARLGYSNFCAFDGGEAALAGFDSGRGEPEVLLLDINMPGMDGVELVRCLAVRRFRGCIILVSGEDAAMLRATAMLARLRGLSVIGALSKPPQLSELKTLLHACETEAARRKRRQAPIEGHAYTAEELERALADDQLVNHYQPKVRVKTGEVTGVEALVRWQHPEHGLVPPYKFVSLAESAGLIDELTRAVLRKGLAALKTWQRHGLELRLAVNISMDSLRDVDSANYITAEVAAALADPRWIILEVTESRLMRDLTTVLDVLARLHLKRFGLAIDDFGTGHSSLVVLRDLVFDQLKVDAGFVRGAGSDKRLASFVQASLDLARHLSLEAVAEGVETLDDWNFLRSSGCEIAQGYFIARPMPDQQLIPWMAQWRDRVRLEQLCVAVA